MTLASCAVAIALLFDVSASVSPDSYDLQRNGTAAAFRSESVGRAIRQSPGGVAISILEWSSPEDQRITVPWVVLQSGEDARRLASQIETIARTPGRSTALGAAMRRGVEMMTNLPCEAERRVIDVSGDGDSNDGDDEPTAIRDRAAAEGIVINGLPIVTRTSPHLSAYFRHQVITPGGFVMDAEGFAEIGTALTRKLVHEIADSTPEPATNPG